MQAGNIFAAVVAGAFAMGLASAGGQTSGVSDGTVKIGDPLEEGVLLAIRDVTESVRAQSDRDRFFEVAKDLLLVVSADGAIVRASASFLEAVGLGRDAVEGSMLSDHIHPDDRGAARTCFADLFVNATHCDLELRLRRSDGTSRWIAWRCPPADAGRVHVVGRDVTNEREARAALALAESQFQAIFDESPIATAAVSTTGGYLHVNDAFCRLTGYSRAELAHLRFADLSGGFPEDVERNVVLFESALRGERDHYELEKRYRRKDGSIVWVHLTVGVLREPSGAVRAFVAQAQDIDARREAEAALRASECLFREFAESLDGVAWVTDPNREEFLFVSSAFERLWGHPPRDVATERVAWLDAVHPDDRERVIAATRRLPTEAFDIEYRARRRDGQLRWVRERALPIPGATGDVLRIAGFSQDVTANKTVLESLRASEERYRRLLKVLPDAVLGLAGDARVVEANTAATALLGADGGSVVGSRVEDFLEWLDEEESGGLSELVAHKVRVDSVARRARRRSDGAVVALEVSAAPFEDEPGATVVLRDVTRRLEFEREVQRQREELVAARALNHGSAPLRQIIDLVPHFIFAKDFSGRYVLANRAIAEAFGTTAEAFEGKTDADFTTPEEARRFRADDLAVIESGQPKVIPEETVTDAQGRVRVLSTVKIPFSFAGSGTAAVLGVAIDVTDQRRLENQLAHAQKLEGLGRLAGGIAHDFNNGLGAILMFSELLVLRLANQPDLRADAEAIRDVALRSADLTRDLLAFSRQGDVSPTPVDVGELLARLRRLLQKVVGDDVRVTLPPPPPGLVVRVDVARLEQVLVNLAINARDAMPAGGTLAMTLREVDSLEIERRAGVQIYAILVGAKSRIGDQVAADHFHYFVIVAAEFGIRIGIDDGKLGDRLSGVVVLIDAFEDIAELQRGGRLIDVVDVKRDRGRRQIKRKLLVSGDNGDADRPAFIIEDFVRLQIDVALAIHLEAVVEGEQREIIRMKRRIRIGVDDIDMSDFRAGGRVLVNLESRRRHARRRFVHIVDLNFIRVALRLAEQVLVFDRKGIVVVAASGRFKVRRVAKHEIDAAQRPGLKLEIIGVRAHQLEVRTEIGDRQRVDERNIFENLFGDGHDSPRRRNCAARPPLMLCDAAGGS
mgnify:CR=1 FL=1